MYLYKISVGDNEGCSNVTSYNLKARTFDEVYAKAKAMLVKDIARIQRESAKEKPEDRVKKSYAYVIEGIEKIADIDG